MLLKRVNTFTIPVNFTIPGDGVNVWKPVTIQATYRTLPQDQLDALREKQEDRGNIVGLLDEVLDQVSGFEVDEKKEDGTPYTLLEVAKGNQFASSALVMAFWDTVTRDVKAKNSSTSPKR